MDICLTSNHLPDFSFLSPIWSESETNVELHPNIPVCVFVEKITYCVTVDTFDYRLLLLISLHYFVQSVALFLTAFS